MDADWHKKYDAAVAEAKAARAVWEAADAAMARANHRREAADREVSRLFQELIRIVNA